MGLPDLITIIHINRSGDLPPQPRFWALWRAKNPRLRLHSYGSNSASALIRTHFPSFSRTYEALTHPVEQADFARYLAIHRLGGIYADGDIVPVLPVALWASTFGWRWAPPGSRENSFDRGLLNSAMVVGVEDTRPLRISQFVFASVPRHPLLLAVAEEVRTRLERITSRRSSVIHRTGPVHATELNFENACRGHLILHPSGMDKGTLPSLITGGLDERHTQLHPLPRPAWPRISE